MEKMAGPSMLFYLMDLDHRSQHNKFGLRYDCKADKWQCVTKFFDRELHPEVICCCGRRCSVILHFLTACFKKQGTNS